MVLVSILASVLVHDENCPFTATLGCLEFKKSVTVSNALPEISFCFNLCQRPLCYTLSNALNVSKNVPRPLRPS